ncbi:acetyl-CoA carboxylase biotin carboxyl carrier protein [bacterium]|nr:acetyl-CoA carboxylase biotin carboxyl carrier protein [bacterium]
MKNINTDYVEKLVEIMKNNEITEVTLEDNDASLVIKSNGFVPVIKEKEQPVVQETIVEKEVVVEENIANKVVPIVSNMIGIFYAKPSPNDAPFVKVGDEVKEGDTICIIETIKLMNKIASTATGKVVEVCIEDGKPVEYGQVIMYVEEN